MPRFGINIFGEPKIIKISHGKSIDLKFNDNTITKKML